MSYNDYKMICCVTGNRPQKFPWEYGCGDEMKKYHSDMNGIVKDLIEQGYNYFLSGGALGVDQDFAETVLSLKAIYPKIRLEIAVPCRTQAARWSESEQERYQAILKQANFVNVLSETHTRFCMQKRNEYMVKKSDLILAFWNGEKEGGTWNTISFSQKAKKPLKIYSLKSLSFG